MPKVDILSRLRPETLQALAISRQQYASFQPNAASAANRLQAARQGYNHERAYWNSFAVPLPAVRDLALDTGHGTVALRLYQPAVAGPLPVLLYAHGGGFMLGNLDTHDRICRLLARQSGWAVLAIDYALAPEKQFPVQPDQVFAVLQHVAAHGSAWGLDPSRIALAGAARASQCPGSAPPAASCPPSSLFYPAPPPAWLIGELRLELLLPSGARNSTALASTGASVTREGPSLSLIQPGCSPGSPSCAA